MGGTILEGNSTENLPFFMALSSDGKTGAEGITPTVTISKNASAFASPVGAVSEIGKGWYSVAAHPDDADTPGILIVHGEEGTCDDSEEVFDVQGIYEAEFGYAVFDGVTVLTTVPRVKKFLPENLSSQFTSAAICEEILAAHDEYVISVQPKTPSTDRPMDGLIETMLAAVTVRQQIDTLGDEEDSKTTRLQKRVARMIALRRDSPDLPTTSYGLPVGPDGRDGEGDDAPHRIFEVPRPGADDYDGVTADTPHRPGNWSD